MSVARFRCMCGSIHSVPLQEALDGSGVAHWRCTDCRRRFVLALDATGEQATLVTTVDCGGHWPRDLALDPAGRRLYAANERSGDVSWFDIDPETGIPRRAGSLAAPAVSCVIFG